MIVMRVPLSMLRIKLEENNTILNISMSLKVLVNSNIAFNNSIDSILTLYTNHTNDSHSSNRNHPLP